MLSAQKLADAAVDDAKHKAETIVKEAQDKASALMDDAREEKANLEKGVEALHIAAKEYKKNFLALIDGQKQLLESKIMLFKDE